MAKWGSLGGTRMDRLADDGLVSVLMDAITEMRLHRTAVNYKSLPIPLDEEQLLCNLARLFKASPDRLRKAARLGKLRPARQDAPGKPWYSTRAAVEVYLGMKEEDEYIKN